MPRTREVYDGHFPPQDLYFSEKRPTVLNPLPPLLFSPFIFLFKGNINLSYLAAQFFFSGVIFILFYFFGRLFFQKRIWSFLLGFLGTLTPAPFIYYNLRSLGDIWENSLVMAKQFIPLVNTEIHKLFLARIDDPLLTYPIFLSAILTFYLFWKKPSFGTAVLGGFFTGLISYSYFHYLAYWGLAVVILFLYVAIFERKNKILLKNFLIFGCAAFIIVIPYLLNYLQFKNFSVAGDPSLRYGIAQGRSIEILFQSARNYPIAITFGIVAYLLYWKNDKKKAIFLSGLAVAMMLVFNLQFFTGFMPVPGQSQKAIAPIIFLIGVIFVHDLIAKFFSDKPLWNKIVFWILLTTVILIPLKKAINVFAIWNPGDEIVNYYRFSRDIIESWDWINENLDREPKIASSSLVNSLYLTTYTSARPYLATGFASSMPMKDLEQRYLTVNKIFGVKKDILIKRLTEKLDDCIADCPPDSWYNLHKDYRFLYVNYFYRGVVLKGGTADFPEHYLDDLIKRYGSFEPTWQDIDAKYVYYGPWEKQFSHPNLKSNEDLILIYENPSVEIYKIKR